MELGGTCFKSDLVRTEIWDDGNLSNGDDEDATKKVRLAVINFSILHLLASF